MKAYYDEGFYQARDSATSHFADRLSKILSETFSPASALDLGCGVGTVLHALKRRGCADILGVEGPWLEQENLVISKSEFRSADLTKPLRINRVFDIAMCLEVAEHLEARYADTIVQTLCHLSSRIVFSAAIPYQGGMNHVNERWQSFWAAKFLDRGYMPFDMVRPAIWADKNVPTYYRQNCLVYLRKDFVAKYPELGRFEVDNIDFLDRVHPDLYLSILRSKEPLHISYRELLRYLPKATYAAAKRAAKRVASVIKR
jgi:SAM-dependent methyltransferase